jgi:hypothetical protein
MKVDFENISNKSRIWIYQSNDEFNKSDIKIINEKSDEFIKNWKAHNKDLKSAYTILHNRFIVIAIDEDFNPIGGCSIDYSLRLIKDISNTINKNLLDRMTIIYRDNTLINSISLNEFKSQIKNGLFSNDTLIFDTTINSKQELLDKFEVKLSNSWLSKFMR